jgi:hypothetical protein
LVFVKVSAQNTGRRSHVAL